MKKKKIHLKKNGVKAFLEILTKYAYIVRKYSRDVFSFHFFSCLLICWHCIYSKNLILTET